jgi:uncharacterized protein YacL
LVDTSAIIDGRIADIGETGFLPQTLVIPHFILKELQNIADSADPLRRHRGRQGLETLNRLKNHPNSAVEVTDVDAREVPDVDGKLVKLGRQLSIPIVTNDFNLNRVAELHGVQILNINQLAHAVKSMVLPGEDMTVEIIQEGKERQQGVGYLDDGTMIVVENGRRHLHLTIEVVVTRVLQTVAGRMIFAHPKGEQRVTDQPLPGLIVVAAGSARRMAESTRCGRRSALIRLSGTPLTAGAGGIRDRFGGSRRHDQPRPGRTAR